MEVWWFFFFKRYEDHYKIREEAKRPNLEAERTCSDAGAQQNCERDLQTNLDEVCRDRAKILSHRCLPHEGQHRCSKRAIDTVVSAVEELLRRALE